MLSISRTWAVCNVHTESTSSPLGATNHFVWPGPLFLSPSFSFSPHSCPLTLCHPLVPKPDIKKGLLKNNMGNFLPPRELSHCSEIPLSLLPSLSIQYSLPVKIWRGNNNSRGMVRCRWVFFFFFFGGGAVYFFQSVCFTLSIVCQQRLGEQQQQQQRGIWRQEGGESETWLPSDRPSAGARERKS